MRANQTGKKGRVLEEEYNTIKMLTNHGIKEQEIMRITGRGHATVSRIKASCDYEGYLDYVRKHGYKKTPDVTETVDEEHLSKEMAIYKAVGEILRSLIAIRDALCPYIQMKPTD